MTKHSRAHSRILALLLALAMCLGLLPGTALASSTSSVTASPSGKPAVEVREPLYPDLGTQDGLIIHPLQTVWAYDSTFRVETSITGEYIVKLLVDYPDGYSYADGYEFTAQRQDVYGNGYGIYTIPGFDDAQDNYTVTVSPVQTSQNWTAVGMAARSAGNTEQPMYTHEYSPSFIPLDPTEVLPHDFSRWPFKGWLCEETGKLIAALETVIVDRDMTLVAQWGEDQTPAARSYEVYFSGNGGTVSLPQGNGYWEDEVDGEAMVRTLTEETGLLSVFPKAERTGYVFDGWYASLTGNDRVSEQTDLSAYVGNGAKQGFQWANDQIILFAHWTEAAKKTGFRINFFPNGGLLTDVGGYSHDLLVGKTGDGQKYQEATNAGIGIDRYSEIGWMNTDADGRLSSLPGAAREGYTFDGWYVLPTDTDLWSKLGENYVQEVINNFNNMTKATASTGFNGEVTLVAKWTPAKNSCTVTYDWNGAALYINSIAPQTVAYGGKAPLYGLNGDIYGHTLEGWETEDGRLWTNTMKVTEDMTLYAVWAPEFEDDFNFGNFDGYFDDYQVSKKYLDYLVQGEKPTKAKEIRTFAANEEWGGSCFGMSAVYAMKKGGFLDVGVFQSGAKNLRDLEAPNESDNVRDLINFYMLSQMTAASVAAKNEYYGEKNLATRYQNILNDIKTSGGLALLGFNYGGGNGHAVIAKSVSGNQVSIWDPNRPGMDITLTVSGSTARFNGPDANLINDYNNKTELKYIMPLDTRAQSYDAKNLQAVFQSSADKSAAAAARSTQATLTSTVGDFTVTAADGRTATVKNGDPSGDLDMTRTYLEMGADSVFRYELDAADAKNLTVTLNSADAVVQVVTDDVYARVEAVKLKAVTVSEVSVTTSAAASGKQAITLVSEKLDDQWNSVTVTGSDTGFQVGAAKGKLTVSSNNDVSATVVGENTDTWEESKAQTVSVTPAGVSLTVAQLSGGAASAPIPFPFTDVPENEWYHPFVKAAYESGLVDGVTKTTYQPDKTLTLAESVTLAARIYAENHGETAPSGTGAQWYKPAYDYCVEKSIIDKAVFALDDMPRTATRFEMVTILDGAIPSERMDNSVQVTRIPDLLESDPYGAIVYRWYRAGLVAGDNDGSFCGAREIKRSEVAKILCTINRLA